MQSRPDLRIDEGSLRFSLARPIRKLVQGNDVHADLLLLALTLFADEPQVPRQVEIHDLRRHSGGAGSAAEKSEGSRLPSRLLEELAPGAALGILRALVADEPGRKTDDSSLDRGPKLLHEDD